MCLYCLTIVRNMCRKHLSTPPSIFRVSKGWKSAYSPRGYTGKRLDERADFFVSSTLGSRKICIEDISQNEYHNGTCVNRERRVVCFLNAESLKPNTQKTKKSFFVVWKNGSQPRKRPIFQNSCSI